MQNRTPVFCSRCRAEGFRGEGDFDHLPDLAHFTPVPRKYRHDGWTPERQRAFIAALAETGSVSHAAKALNMSAEGAYYLRRQPGADEFRAAWEAALDYGVRRLLDVTMERAIYGVPVPVFHKGEQVGEKRWYNDRLAMFHLRHRLPERYGALVPPARGTKSPETIQREWQEQQAERERLTERTTARLKRKIDAIHDAWRAMLSKDPRLVEAYELLFGPDGEEERTHPLGHRLARLPKDISYQVIGAQREAPPSKTDDA